MGLIFLSNNSRRVGTMEQALERLQAQGDFKDSKVYALEGETEWSADWDSRLSKADAVVIKWMGATIDTPFFKECFKLLQRRGCPYYVDAAGSKEGQKAFRFSDQQCEAIVNYSNFGGPANYENLWRYIAACLEGTEASVPVADPLYWAGIYHPDSDKVYDDFESYWADFGKEGAMRVGILFYRDEWIWGDLTYQTALIRAIEARGMVPVCVFSNGMPNKDMGMPTLPEVFERFYSHDTVAQIDVLITAMKFSITSRGLLSTDFFKRWQVPILQAYTLLTEYETWRDSLEGMTPMEVSIAAALPEFDGIVHGVPIANKNILDNGDVRYLPIEERVELMAQRAFKWAVLRHKDRKDKRVAIVFHNYPPGNATIGSAIALDTIESVRRLLGTMKERGYTVDWVPEDTAIFMDRLTREATNAEESLTEGQWDRAHKMPISRYLEYFHQLPKDMQKQLEKDWGPAPGEVMVYDEDILVPGIENGNVFLTVQPPRGFGADPAKIYHSPYTAPTHQYLAVYEWLRTEWKADAVCHIGTHGSLEWLPGKNAGLAETCYPDRSIGDLPNVYPYLMSITGEGIQAKRRGAACLISHLPAPQEQAGLYDTLKEVEETVDEYLHFKQTQPENLPNLQPLVEKAVAAAHLDADLPRERYEDFDDYVLAIHEYLSDLMEAEVHTGLHILGQAPEGRGLVQYCWLLTRLSNGAQPSFPEILAKAYGTTTDELHHDSAAWREDLGLRNSALMQRIEGHIQTLLTAFSELDYDPARLDEMSGVIAEAIPDPETITFGESSDGAPSAGHGADSATTSATAKAPGTGDGAAAASSAEATGEAQACAVPTREESEEAVRQMLTYVGETVVPKLKGTTEEVDHFLDALDGLYVEPGPAGAPSSGGVDLLPTGRNFYGLDPRTLPSPFAWELGKTLGDQVIDRFIAEEGHYPENIGIILWSGSNMRSHGQCIAEIFYLLGVEPVWQRGSRRLIDLKPIPLAELQRPRIDVTARASGLFRDSMATVMEWIDRAVLLVAGLSEESPEDNYVRKHILAEAQELEASGLTADEAWRDASYRVFSDEQGTYGTGVGMVLENKNWTELSDITDIFVRWGGHAYGSGNTSGSFRPEQFKRRLASLDVTLKNEDNHETNIISSDDYNAYHGGMIAAVRSLKGEAPRSYCGDSTNRSDVALRSVEEEMKRVYRTEAMNPKYIEGMMKHGYKGAQELAKSVVYSYQWDATSKVVDDWMYDGYAQAYAFDPKVQSWMREVNPWALQRLTATLLEANQRGLWKASQDVIDELQDLYLSMEGDIEERGDE